MSVSGGRWAYFAGEAYLDDSRVRFFLAAGEGNVTGEGMWVSDGPRLSDDFPGLPFAGVLYVGVLDAVGCRFSVSGSLVDTDEAEA